MHTGKAWSVLESGEADGWEIQRGFAVEMTPNGQTRLVAAAPFEELGRVHAALVGALSGNLGVLYRKKIDRVEPKPQGWPGKDYVGLDVEPSKVLAALADFAGLLYDDARHEFWLRGSYNEQVVLDQDGVLYCYPDDPAFRDALQRCGLTECKLETMQDRDYVRHWFHGEYDAQEDGLIAALQLTPVATRHAG